MFKHQMYKAICEKFDVHWKTAERYLGRARKLIADDLFAGAEHEEIRAIIVARLNNAGEQGDAGDRIKANVEIAKLLGMYTTKIEIGRLTPVELAADPKVADRMKALEQAQLRMIEHLKDTKPTKSTTNGNGTKEEGRYIEKVASSDGQS